ncbi:MAG: SsrA-binding protein SmpB [Bacteroidetes bacterium]|nr:SsrA-binding protein SmpB [Bacteroidota bacterium]MBU1114640.1 SsrA-binding protein SmpB [Bacteroidota bacterium]MBU1798184.1 SsrA-binding protein SmpB [Bacteroidota bacterium]
MQKNEEKNITSNRKAFHDYFIEQTIEVGVVLLGTEVKALRNGKANLVDAYASIKNDEVWMINAHIGVYDHGNINNHEPLRIRKLLLKRSEIRKLDNKIKQKGYSLIPLRIYFSNGKVKVEIGLARGKKAYDKRETIKLKDAKRDLDRSVKL